jgi:formiminotetrahydrofolate cyclodeaminase
VYRTGTIEQYVADASAKLPAPGGGSVSALAGALGAAMAAMAANFTVGKKKFRDVEPEVRQLLDQLQAGTAELLELMDQDVEAYSAVGEAYALPKDTPEHKQARTAAIQDALKVALATPLACLRRCHALIDLLDRLVAVANPNLISDVGVAAILLEAALRGARLNVEINLAWLKDAAFVEQTNDEIKTLAFQASETAASVLDRVYKKMGWTPA